MFNDDVCRGATDKQTHIYKKKHISSKNRGNLFFTAKFFYFLFFFSNSLKVKKDGFQNVQKMPERLGPLISLSDTVPRDTGVLVGASTGISSQMTTVHHYFTTLSSVTRIYCGISFRI